MKTAFLKIRQTLINLLAYCLSMLVKGRSNRYFVKQTKNHVFFACTVEACTTVEWIDPKTQRHYKINFVCGSEESI